MTYPACVAPLIWGHGPVKFDIFIEPTCPFSVRTINKIHRFLEQIGEGAVTLELHLHSQPWHLFSPLVVRSILAASLLPEGREQAWKVLKAVADHRDEFEFTHHSSGPNMNVTPEAIVNKLEHYSGVSIKQTFESEYVTKAMKRHAKYSRQNGIHVSPTFMVNGLIDERFSSGEDIIEWVARLS